MQNNDAERPKRYSTRQLLTINVLLSEPFVIQRESVNRGGLPQKKSLGCSLYLLGGKIKCLFCSVLNWTSALFAPIFLIHIIYVMVQFYPWFKFYLRFVFGCGNVS